MKEDGFEGGVAEGGDNEGAKAGDCAVDSVAVTS